jgi:poly-gamma-glutamate synthesis protein (capsule biosynthesis protein)
VRGAGVAVAAGLTCLTAVAAQSGTGGGRATRTEITIAASGDLLIHAPVWLRAASLGHGGFHDFRPMLARIRRLIRSADVSLCHVETPIGAGAPAGYPRFNAPPGLAVAIRWTGWDACSTASNHTLDRGQYGVAATLATLDRWNVRHTGSARSRRERRRILILAAGGIRVAVLAYTYGTNGLPLPRPWSVNLIEPARIAADARRARREGADLVVVNLHWGVEYRHEPSREQIAVARALVRRDAADVIVGQHVHVVQPIRRVRGRFVVFGEGNLLSNQTAACCPAASQDGFIALIRVRREGDERPRVVRVDYVPTWVRHPEFVVEPVGYTLARLVRTGSGAGGLATELRRSYWRTVAVAGVGSRTRPLPSPSTFQTSQAAGVWQTASRLLPSGS